MTGHYASNTTIAWWELVNEAAAPTAANNSCPTAADEANAATWLQSFAADMVGAIKGTDPDHPGADPNHMVSLGTSGGHCGANYHPVGATPTSTYYYSTSSVVDICSVHDYGTDTNPEPGADVSAIASCKALGKPLYMGESGISAKSPPKTGTITADSLLNRAHEFSAKLTAQVGGSDAVTGFLIWQKVLFPSDSADNASSDHGSAYGVGPGDDVEPAMRYWSGRYGTVIADWEDGTTRGWSANSPHLQLTPDAKVAGQTSYAYTNFGWLHLADSYAFETVKLSLNASANSGLDGDSVAAIPPSSLITYRVFVPAGAADVTIKPYFATGATTYSGIAQNFTAGAAGSWNVVMQTVPANAGAITQLGLNVTFKCTKNSSGTCINTPASNELDLDTISYQPLPRTVQFAATKVNVTEGDEVMIKVTRAGGSSGSVSVSYATSPGTAQQSDFVAAQGTLTWADGDSSPKFFAVQANHDATRDSGETVNLTLSSPSMGISLGSPSTATLTIVDDSDDPPPQPDPCPSKQGTYCQFGPITTPVDPTVIDPIYGYVPSDPIGTLVQTLPEPTDVIAPTVPTSAPDTQLPDSPDANGPVQETCQTVFQKIPLGTTLSCDSAPPVNIPDPAAVCQAQRIVPCTFQ